MLHFKSGQGARRLGNIPHALPTERPGKQAQPVTFAGVEKKLHTFRHGDRAVCVAFHPNGRQLASGSCDNTAKVWDLDTGQEVETLRSHIGYVMAVAYSPDGKLLATGSGNRHEGEVQLWDTATLGKRC